MWNWRKIFLVSCVLLCLLLGGCASTENSTLDSNTAPDSFSEVIERVMPSVVYILAESAGASPGQTVRASGSGVIFGSDGHILTNRHVVENAQRVEVTLQDGSVFEADSVVADDLSDLAVIKVDAQDLPPCEFGDPATVNVGDWVTAIGHPLGLSPEQGGATVTAGIVSNLGRSFVISGIPYYDIIQTDAAINPGNSGGPLVDVQGKVIGINSAVLSGAQSIGYAINVSTARRVFEDLIEHGRVIRPYLGVVLDDITPSTACEFCLAQRLGAVIVVIEPGSPAQLAGLELNDVIVRLGETEITSATQLIRELWTYTVGETLRVVFWRGETEMEANVLLTERPG
jgi:serine protease Do